MKNFRKYVLLLTLSVLVAASSILNTQENGKKAMTIQDYGRWRSITSVTVSDNGDWMTYAYSTPNADDTLYVKSLLTETKIEIPRGSNPHFSDDARWIVCTINMPREKAEKLREEKKPVPEKTQLVNLLTKEKFTYDNTVEPAPETIRNRYMRRRSTPSPFAKGSKFVTVKKAATDSEAKHKGTDLILRHLEKDYDELIGSVSEYGFNKAGTMLAYIVDAADTSGNGVIVIDLETGARRVLDTDRAVYEKLTWDEKGTAIAVLKGTLKKGFEHKDNVLLAFTKLNTDKPVIFKYNPGTAADFPKDMVISENGTLEWSKDLSTVFLGIKEQEEKQEKKKDADPVADVDIWHWKDNRLQSVQKIRANTDRNFTYRSAVSLSGRRFIRLTDENMRTIEITKNGRWGIGENEKPYISDWKERKADFYRVNTSNGERTLMFRAQGRTLGLSPDSRHFLYWKDGHIWVYKIETDEKINLTQNAPVSFVDDEYDHPGSKPPYGVAGWTKDEKAVILEHKYDLWLQPLDGSKARNLTQGIGDKNKIRFRYIDFDPEEEFIDLTKPVLLSAFGRWTKKSGYYRLYENNLEELIYDDKYFGNIIKPENSDKYIFTIETFENFPDYYVCDEQFTYPGRLTDANPWQHEYKWGKRILFEYSNKDGIRLQGTLAIPEDYEEGQKLPMLVQFYEKYSQNLHRYPTPVFRDTPQAIKYVSNSYLFMQPDVHFNTGYTHSDMLECVEAAVKKVIEMGYADPLRIGLHGHSFSGQGAAFISTQSKMFAAIVYGAGATNLISDFNQIWKSAGTNQHRYDIYGQGRFGTNPYDNLELYLHESAVTHARNVTTPLLIMHGTDDGSVEWLQAIEFYNALRFNGKNVILASYPKQGHHLDRLENKIDFQTRMEQFLDHYLKGKPAPEWMTKGVPFLKKKKK